MTLEERERVSRPVAWYGCCSRRDETRRRRDRREAAKGETEGCSGGTAGEAGILAVEEEAPSPSCETTRKLWFKIKLKAVRERTEGRGREERDDELRCSLSPRRLPRSGLEF